MGGRERRFVLAVGLAAALPVVVSAIHAIAVGWIALGDDAVIVARAYDVLSAHPPLLGQFSAFSGMLGRDVHSLGPLQYWLLALPAHVGPSWGPAVLTALVNASALVGCVALAHRRGGRALAVATGAALAVAVASQTAETWHTVWNPSVALLPFALLIFTCWSLACGDVRLLALAVLLASFVAQCHLTYVAPALGLLAVGLAGLARARPAAWRRPALAAVLVGLVSWAAPLAEEAIHRPGNLELVARSAGAGGPKLGATVGWHAVVRTVGIAPWWLRGPRDGFARFVDVGVAPGALAVISALIVLAGLAAALALGLRHGRADAAAAGAIGLVLCAAVFVVASSTPSSGILYESISYTLRWASFAGMFCWLAAGFALAPRLPRLEGRAALAGAAGVAVAGALVATSAGRDRLQPLYGPVRASAAELDRALPADRSVRVQAPMVLSPAGFDVPAGLVAALRRSGRAPQTREYASQFGRTYAGSAPEAVARVTGPHAGEPFAVTLSAGEAR